jgi:outer membrane lipoprotein LolB
VKRAARAGQRAGWLVVCALLAGCAGLATVKNDTSSTFNAEGRISVHYKDLKGGKEDTLFGRFDWVEHDRTVDLALLDPLGQGIATVHAEPDNATLKLNDGRVFHGPSAEALTLDALGYTIPVTGLRSWLQGRSSIAGSRPGDNPDGGLVLKESGWTIDYPDKNMPPRRIDLHYPGPDIALDLRIAVEAPGGN